MQALALGASLVELNPAWRTSLGILHASVTCSAELRGEVRIHHVHPAHRPEAGENADPRGGPAAVHGVVERRDPDGDDRGLVSARYPYT